MTFGLALPLAFLFGMLAFDSGAGPAILVGLLGLGLVVAVLLPEWRRRLLVLPLVGLALAGCWRAWSASPAMPVGINASGPVTLRAQVIGQPRRYADHTGARLRLRGSDVAFDASLPSFPSVREGDLLRLRVSVTPDVTGVRASRIFVTSVTVEGSSASRAVRLRNRLNESIRGAVQEHIAEPAGSLTLGVLTGDDSGMTDTTRLAFRRAGLSHISAVSGWNLALVASALVLLLRAGPVPLLVRLAALLAAIWIYAFLVGLDASVVRAAAMSSLFLVARWRGRPADVISGLLWGVAAVLAVQPSLRLDIGFQLSVAATVALSLVAPVIAGRPAWQASLAVPAVAELAVAPLTLHHFGSYSLLSPLSNVLVEALLGPVMAGGALVVAASRLHPLVADGFGAATWVPARVIVLVAESSNSLGFGFGQTPQLGWTGTVLAYAVLLGVWFGATNRASLRAWLERGELQTGV